jgi:hypothetical protein
MREDKFKVQISVGKAVSSVFWDNEEILLGEFSKRCATANSERYKQTL